MKKYNLIFALILTTFSFFSCRGQNIDYSMLNCSVDQLTNYLNTSKEYFVGRNYYSAKNTKFTIQFYNTTGVYVNYKIRNSTFFSNIVSNINSKAFFRFKYCSDYNSPIVYNYETSSGNKIRYNYDELMIQVQYPSSLNTFFDSNSEFLPVFVCTRKVSYAYHTNLKCEGLQNCESQIAKSTIKEAKKYGYKICEICTNN
jgi:hypothetical protein